MAVLPDNDRRDLWARLMRHFSELRDPLEATKPELRAAVDGLDDWVEANAVAINRAIPASVRSKLTTAQKATVLAYVALRRAGLS